SFKACPRRRAARPLRASVIIALALITAYAASPRDVICSPIDEKRDSVDLIELCDLSGISYRYDQLSRRLTLSKDGMTADVVAGDALFTYSGRISTSDSPVVANGIFTASAALASNLTALLGKNTPGGIRFSIADKAHTNDTRSNTGIAFSIEEKKMNTITQTPLSEVTIRPRSANVEVIVIDPGHGGRDPGAIGVGDIREKDIVLDISGMLRDAVSRAVGPSTKVVMTHDKDVFMTLEDRSIFANNAIGIGTKEQKNGIFVSVHANASFNRSSRGFEVYFVSAVESSEYARATASFENSSVIDFERGSFSYTNYTEGIYYKMIIEQYQKESSMLSGFIKEEVFKGVREVAERTKPVQSALFYVLKGVLMPAVLVETGFVTNPQDAKLITDKSYQAEMANSIAAGIVRYVRLFEKTKGFTE
ncbi:MAG: N-acetylmuramoyl-L-alanine amidase, partial [Spirochaetota bacterium]